MEPQSGCGQLHPLPVFSDIFDIFAPPALEDVHLLISPELRLAAPQRSQGSIVERGRL